ncbi:hypothetical protein [Streptomyces sp. NPDC002746]
MHVWESRVVVRLADHLIYYPNEAWTLELDHQSLSGDDILNELQRIPTLDGELGIPHSNSIRGSQSQTNWGASGSFGEYVIDISVNIAGGIGAAGFAALVQTVFGRIAKHSPSPQQPLTPEEARNLLKSHLALHYGVPIEQLTETESTYSLDLSVTELSFLSTDGTEYGGSVGDAGETRRCTRVWRRAATPTVRPEFRTALTGETE